MSLLFLQLLPGWFELFRAAICFTLESDIRSLIPWALSVCALCLSYHSRACSVSRSLDCQAPHFAVVCEYSTYTYDSSDGLSQCWSWITLGYGMAESCASSARASNALLYLRRSVHVLASTCSSHTRTSMQAHPSHPIRPNAHCLHTVHLEWVHARCMWFIVDYKCRSAIVILLYTNYIHR